MLRTPRALLNAVGWERCRVVGVSFGGMVAQEFAIRFPSRVERLVLACTSAAAPAARPIRYTSCPTCRRMHARGASSRAPTRASMPRGRRRIPSGSKPSLRWPRRHRKARTPPHTPGWRGSWKPGAGHDTYDRLPCIGCPAFICGGRFDGIAQPANLEAIARQIPGAQLELFDGGHYFMLQDPAAFEHMIEFLVA